VFQKKSKRGIATPKPDIDLTESLGRSPAELQGKAELTCAKTKIRVQESSGNIFADLALPNPEQELLKAQLTLQIYKIIKQRWLTQAQAGEILGIKQPHVSAGSAARLLPPLQCDCGTPQ
jgi:predicted XRE-type DNA-binding protein